MSIPIKRDRARFSVSQLVHEVRAGRLILNAEPCSLTIKNVFRNIAMPVFVFHRSVSHEGDCKYTALSGEPRLAALFAEANRIETGCSNLSKERHKGSPRSDCEIDRFWLYNIDIEMLGGSLEEATLVAKEISEAWRD